MVATGNPTALARMPQLDGLRGLAALAVFAFHGWLVSAWTVSSADGVLLFGATRALSLGWSGVDLFFTLSAFLLSLPFAKAARDGMPAPRPGRYYLRRLRRILPAYWFQLLLVGLLMVAESDPLEWVQQALMLYPVGAPTHEPWVPVWWTLPVEFGFYLLLPALAVLLRPRRWAWLLVFVPAAWLWRMLLLATDIEPGLRFALADHLPGRIDQFAIGMLGAYAWVRLELAERLAAPARSDGLAAIAIVALLLLLLAPLWLDAAAGPAPSAHPWLIGWHGLASLALLPLLWAAAAGRSRLLGWLGARPLRMLGAISFSLYLWHYPLMLLMRPWVDWLPASPLRPFLFNTAVFLPCVLVAWLSWRLVERPGMQWRSRPGAVRASAQPKVAD